MDSPFALERLDAAPGQDNLFDDIEGSSDYPFVPTPCLAKIIFR